MSKEALFNVLTNRFYFDEIRVLDLFSGTGNISLEFASRGVEDLVAVDQNFRCCAFLTQTAGELKLPGIEVVRDDVLKYIERRHAKPFDLIFADPPYDMNQLPELPGRVMGSDLLKPAGLFILEHPSYLRFAQQDFFQETRRYGQSSFSFFQSPSS